MPSSCSQTELTDDPASWDPNHCAVSRTAVPVGDAPGQRRVVVLRHAAYPFARTINAPDDPALGAKLVALATEYIGRVRPVAGLPDAWIEALCGQRDPHALTFDWLPIQWGLDALHSPPATADPRYSFWVARYPAGSVPPRSPLDRTLVLLASYVFVDTKGLTRSFGSEQGLRIVLHVRATPQSGVHKARITSLSAAFLSAVEPPPVPNFSARIASVQEPIARVLGLRNTPDDPLRFRGLGFVPGGWQLFGSALGDFTVGVAPKPYEFTAAISGTWELGRALKWVRQAHAADKAVRHLFIRDPASAGPPETIRERRRRRTNERLNQFRVETAGIPSDLVRAGLLQVRQSPFVDQAVPSPSILASDRQPSDPTKPEKIATNLPFPPRASAVDAAHAYYHGSDLFDRLIAFGLGLGPVDYYFKVAKLPLILRFRSGVAPGAGSDGQTVNAQVEFFPGDPDFQLPISADNDRPQLEVELALGDLKRRSRPLLDHRGINRVHPRAAYLGIGADPRWVWHEFGHVLLGATTGELELRFAHSVGDALAVINADPRSELVKPRSWLGLERLGWRGVTYPWIGSIRRHDRDVYLGWSWSGTFHRATRLRGDTLRSNRKAYVSEQILSTTLFRLYRSLGGDTNTASGAFQPDRDARAAAADYVVYLIMRAAQLLGPVSAVPAETVEQFVDALIDADVGTEAWNVQAKWPYEKGVPARQLSRLGGYVHKVIRWAFEAQGLYAAYPVAIIDAPGEPPSVDLYLDDDRPDSQGAHSRGGYMPVSLHWSLGVGAAAPLWHAPDQAIEHDKPNKQIWLNVNNRGAVAAVNVAASVWYRDASNAAAQWIKLNPTAALPTAVPASASGADGTARFGPFPFAPGVGTYLVAAVATCPADPANSAGPDGTPLWTKEGLLRDLVAHDNNIGLRVIKIP